MILYRPKTTITEKPFSHRMLYIINSISLAVFIGFILILTLAEAVSGEFLSLFIAILLMLVIMVIITFSTESEHYSSLEGFRIAGLISTVFFGLCLATVIGVFGWIFWAKDSFMNSFIVGDGVILEFYFFLVIMLVIMALIFAINLCSLRKINKSIREMSLIVHY